MDAREAELMEMQFKIKSQDEGLAVKVRLRWPGSRVVFPHLLRWRAMNDAA
jgi:hypothetical protein